MIPAEPDLYRPDPYHTATCRWFRLYRFAAGINHAWFTYKKCKVLNARLTFRNDHSK
ncbi:hypothetical protein DESC_540020 [Desulfosarcina cetonica]|nr:hypothetical protein DESC_540020 [Desulfosarcina cetonica]